MQHNAQWLVRMVENLLSVTRLDAEKVRVTDDGCGIPPGDNRYFINELSVGYRMLDE